MGTDIHLYQEKRVGDRWVTADDWTVEEDGEKHCPYTDRLYHDRNYRLFAVLAGVRNGVGFAGVKTGEPVVPIAPPRGVPADCCPEYRAEVDGWGSDGHSHSWVTLADLEGYAWPTAIRRGYVALDVYRAWRRSGAAGPRECCDIVHGSRVVKIPATAADLLDPNLPDGGELVYVACAWQTSTREDCAAFLDVALPRLRELEAQYGSGNARLVFFFDN